MLLYTFCICITQRVYAKKKCRKYLFIPCYILKHRNNIYHWQGIWLTVHWFAKQSTGFGLQRTVMLLYFITWLLLKYLSGRRLQKLSELTKQYANVLILPINEKLLPAIDPLMKDMATYHANGLKSFQSIIVSKISIRFNV